VFVGMNMIQKSGDAGFHVLTFEVREGDPRSRKLLARGVAAMPLIRLRQTNQPAEDVAGSLIGGPDDDKAAVEVVAQLVFEDVDGSGTSQPILLRVGDGLSAVTVADRANPGGRPVEILLGATPGNVGISFKGKRQPQ
jgi:hypothetical protein